jgi:hypothetical protein
VLTFSAHQALVHEFFDELRVEGVKLPNGHDMPALFNWTKEGELIGAGDQRSSTDWQNSRPDQT